MLNVTIASFLTQSCSIGGKRCPLDKSLSSGEHNSVVSQILIHWIVIYPLDSEQPGSVVIIKTRI